jgi:hypothetical protein
MDISSRIAKILIDKDNTNMGRYWGRGEGWGRSGTQHPSNTMTDCGNDDLHPTGFQVLQLIPGRDICIERSIKNPIQNRIYEFAQIMRNIIYVIVDIDTKHCIVVDAVRFLCLAVLCFVLILPFYLY